MQTFEFARPADATGPVAAAARAKTAQKGAEVFLAGGTTLVDLMKLNVETPAQVLDINRLPFDKVEAMPDGGLKIGSSNAAVSCAVRESVACLAPDAPRSG